MPNPANHALYEKYRAMAEREEGVCFVGRLASYKYFNMDQAILNALEMYDNLKETGKLAPKRRPEDFGLTIGLISSSGGDTYLQCAVFDKLLYHGLFSRKHNGGWRRNPRLTYLCQWLG